MCFIESFFSYQRFLIFYRHAYLSVYENLIKANDYKTYFFFFNFFFTFCWIIVASTTYAVCRYPSIFAYTKTKTTPAVTSTFACERKHIYIDIVWRQRNEINTEFHTNNRWQRKIPFVSCRTIIDTWFRNWRRMETGYLS